MVLYFVNRFLKPLGIATLKSPNSLKVIEDKLTEESKTGIKSFEFRIPYDKGNLKRVLTLGNVGNYVLKYNEDDKKTDFFTITESELDSDEAEIIFYTEDAGLDLINHIVPSYPDAEMGDVVGQYDITYYMNKWLSNSGYSIGENEIGTTTKKALEMEESTLSERVLKIAESFDAEVSYSFDIEGLYVKNKKINIYSNKGRETGVKLYKGIHFKKLTRKQNINNVATALQVVGAENNGVITTLDGLTYDDGDFYIADRKDYPSTAGRKALLYSRKAQQKWGRFYYDNNGQLVQNNLTGDIIKVFKFDTVDQQKLLEEAIKELKTIVQEETEWEVEIIKMPNVRIRDIVSIIDEELGIYITAKVTKIEKSEYDNEIKIELSDYSTI